MAYNYKISQDSPTLYNPTGQMSDIPNSTTVDNSLLGSLETNFSSVLGQFKDQSKNGLIYAVESFEKNLFNPYIYGNNAYGKFFNNINSAIVGGVANMTRGLSADPVLSKIFGGSISSLVNPVTNLVTGIQNGFAGGLENWVTNGLEPGAQNFFNNLFDGF